MKLKFKNLKYNPTFKFKRLLMEIFIVIVLFIASVFAFIKFAPVFGGRPDAKSQKLIEASPNFNGKVFINLEPTIDMVKKNPQASMVN